ncbi:hypothetical protein GFB49_12930 [Epibacterium sp. SM1979]|uniref:Uncharacterized protein n=1 Tax=Tritonibacter litoralis TaxID=2662264 RepID=A0A843YIV3_9RHOB|nr:hypothetical protein [Tritonibacter litoralis]MQQ09364.1 hypothetical protein [Tritonibacter litoralis]
MQKELKSGGAHDTSQLGQGATKPGTVKVKSVSAGGNIKIALKTPPDGQPAPAAATSGAPQKAKTAPHPERPPHSLSSASAQGDVLFEPSTSSGRSSLKPLGLAAAALGVLALGLGVLQFSGGRSEAVAQAQPETPAPRPVATLSEPVPAPVEQPVEITKVEPVSAPAPVVVESQPVVAAPKTVAARIVTPEVEPDKAAVVVPVQAAVEPAQQEAEAGDDAMAHAIAQAIAKLGAAPKPQAVPPAPEVKELKFKAASLFQADPAQVAAFAKEAKSTAAEAPVDPVETPVQTRKEVLVLPSSGPNAPSADLVARLTTGTLDALRAPATSAETETRAAVSDIYRLVSDATTAGKSEAEIAEMLIAANSDGRITVPQGFILPDGQVDTHTILSLFIAQ